MEEQLQFRLAREQMILQQHNRHLEELKSIRQQIIADFEESKKKTLSGARYIYFMDSIHIKDQQIKIQITTIQSQERVVAEARKKLTEAMQKRKIIEVIKEKSLQTYLANLQKKEEGESDEQVVLRYGRGGGV
jgi:flagellar export protein FliJ